MMPNASVRRPRLPGLAVGLALALAAPAPARASFVTFESGQVRPLALAPDGATLFAVNTPDGRLEIFDVTDGGLIHRGSVAVGMEPVAVAARSSSEVWVVNHLSDSVSVVDVAADPPRVVRTLLVGDEPRDIVFAGAGGNRAFITTAHRGQQRTAPSLAGVPGAGDPQLTTPGVGRADVWVFDANALGAALGGVPLRIVTLFSDTPRALAVSPDGGTVYAAAFKSGNGTTVLSEQAVCDGFATAGPCVVDGVTVPGGLPGPGTNYAGRRAPETALIVRHDPATGQWLDTLGRDWGPAVQFDLPDDDVFAIDATSLTPTATFSGVGTTLFNMAVNPVSGKLYVSNTESPNEVLFEGPGIFGGSTVQGHLAESRITVISGATVAPRHLNKHIDYSQLPAPPGVKEHSLATPVGMAVSADGSTLYVAAFGSAKVGVFDTAALENDTFDPTTASAAYIPLSGGGPSGVVLDSTRPRLYVLTRFDDTVSVVDLASRAETQRVALHNPEPPSVVAGRPFLYDAVDTSSNGEASCASCHIFGDMDDLAWDLGNPDDDVKFNPIPINLGIAVTSGVFVLPTPINGTGTLTDFHPMKGPMTTQTLRGLLGSGAMHWRGDRANPPGNAASAFNEVVSFNNFNAAFPGLVGRDSEIDPADMQKFTDFALQITLPPNPVRALDNSLTPSQANGRTFFLGPRLSDGTAGTFFNQPLGFTCEGCHRLQPELRHFGTDGRASFENEVQIIKIPHLRNLYQKIGMFGALDVNGETPLNLGYQGPQVRGFGFLHDGSVDTLFRFLNANVFRNDAIGGPNVGFQSNQQRRDVEQFLLAFDSNLAPVVGQQITLDAASAATVAPRIDLLEARAAAGECDLVAKGVAGVEARGWVRLGNGTFLSDRAAEPALSDPALRAIATTPGNTATYTCVPPGSGMRAGVDRDEDGFLDRDELDAGTDPADPTQFPGSSPMLVPTTMLRLRDGATASSRKLRFKSSTKKDVAEAGRIVPPAAGGIGDPTLGGAQLTVYNSAGLTGDVVVVDLPADGWSRIGRTTLQGWRYRNRDPEGPIALVVVKANTITIKGGKAAWSYSLDEVAQGRVAVRLRLGDGEGWCADAPARTGGNPPSSAKYDQPDRFEGQPKTPAPATCPMVPGGGSPSGAFVQ
jgi:DNA-binding beta-propeller fold protein YncE